MKDRIVGIIAASLIGALIAGTFLPPCPWIPMLAIPFIAMGIALAIRARSFRKRPSVEGTEEPSKEKSKEKPKEESKAKRVLFDFITPLLVLGVLFGGLYLTDFTIEKVKSWSSKKEDTSSSSSRVIYWRGNEEDYPSILCKNSGIDVSPGKTVLVKGCRGIIYNKKKYPPKPLWGASRYWLSSEIRKKPGRPRKEEFPFPDEKPASVGAVLVENGKSPLGAEIRSFWLQDQSCLRIKNSSPETRRLILVYNYPFSQSKKGDWGNSYTRFEVKVK